MNIDILYMVLENSEISEKRKANIMRLYRLLHLMNILANSEKTTINSLAEKLEVSKRTVYRDLEALSMAGFPIVSTPGYGGGISVVDGYKFDKNLLSLEDWKQILSGLNAIKTMGDNEKIGYLIGRIAPKDIESINEQSDIIIDLSQWYNDDTQHLLIDIRKAISNRQLLAINYQTKLSSTHREVEPYKLVFKERDWYLYAFCQLRNDFRLFKVNRISSYSIINTCFIPRKIPSLNLDELVKKTLLQSRGEKRYHVILEFELSDKEFLIKTLGALNFKVLENKGIIDFETTNIDYVANLIISLQDKVKVMAPMELYERVLTIICKMKKLYER